MKSYPIADYLMHPAGRLARNSAFRVDSSKLPVAALKLNNLISTLYVHDVRAKSDHKFGIKLDSGDLYFDRTEKTFIGATMCRKALPAKTAIPAGAAFSMTD